MEFFCVNFASCPPIMIKSNCWGSENIYSILKIYYFLFILKVMARTLKRFASPATGARKGICIGFCWDPATIGLKKWLPSMLRFSNVTLASEAPAWLEEEELILPKTGC